MSSQKRVSRRSFLRGGALLAAPLATASVTAAAMADDTLQQRLAHLENEAALRRLHHQWLQRVNAGERDPRLEAGVRRITADHTGAAERLVIAADQASAVGHFDCAVEFATPLALDSTLAQMAHLQGHGVTHHTQRRSLMVRYTKARGVWQVDGLALSARGAGSRA